MSPELATRLVTADELLRFPDDDYRCELVRGEVRRRTPSGARHGQLSIRIGRLLDAHVEAQSLGVAFGAESGSSASS